MISLVWLEMKTILRQPSWVVLAALAALIGFATGFPAPGLPGFLLEAASHASPLTSSAGLSPIASLGEWGRLVLYLVGGVSPLPMSLLTALLLTSTSRPEMDHRQVLWTATVSSRIWALATKPAAASLVAIFCIVLGASSALLHPAVREVLVPAGLEYVPMYILLAWIHILLWAAVSSCLFTATQSRWITLACVVSLDVGCHFLFPSVLSLWSQGRLLWISYTTYQFVSPFAPLGIFPAAFILRGTTEFALALGLIGAAFLVRRRFLEWRCVRSAMAWVLVGIGVFLAVGGAGASTWVVQRHIAPFTLWELWRGQAELDRPYAWSNDGRLLVYLGQYAVLRLPPLAPIPSWVETLFLGRETCRYATRDITVRAEDPRNGEHPPEEEPTFLRDTQDLVMVYPADRAYPPELEGMVRRFCRQLEPMFARAALWQEEPPEIVVIGPHDLLRTEPILPSPEVLLVSAFMMSDAAQAEAKWWWIAWALTETSAVDERTRCYLSLYLMEGWYESEVEQALAWLQGEVEGRSLQEEKQALKRLDRGETEVTVSCGAPPPLCEVAWMKPVVAQRVWEHWERGEEFGHEDYIRSLLKGGQGD